MKQFFLSLLAITGFFTSVASAQYTPGYDVILLAGQSNMVGYGTGPDNATDAATSPQVWMWDHVNGVIVAAKDPFIMNQTATSYVGPSLTFGKAYAASHPNRRVLLVGAAAGGTGFADGWYAPGSLTPSGGPTNNTLSTAAVNFTNSALAAAGAGSQIVGIVWDQGESDVVETGSQNIPYADQYLANLVTLAKYFRGAINGASNTTPFIATELNYYWLVANYNAPANSPTYSATWYAPSIKVQRAIHTLPDVLPYSAWTDTGVLTGDQMNGLIHFNALSQRQIGRRDADRFFEAQLGVPQTQTQIVWSDNYFIDEGRAYLDAVPFNYYPAVSGTVTPVADTARGTIAQISQAAGFLSVNVATNTFNGSYTKMAWFKPGALGYYNNLVSANNTGQAHYLLAVTGNSGQLSLYGGHSDGNSIPLYVSSTVSAPAGQWENIALVYDATAQTMTLYYNGAVASTATNVPAAPQITASGTLPLTFGSFGQTSNGSANAGIDGYLGGERVWTSALTKDQINGIYNQERLYRAGW